jgi:NADPH-dependent 2,4-dienoyl-CoA reductase/sulfur reductase-like enzyme
MVAGYAAKELVERGLRSGELLLLSADSDPPYERPPLSKGFLAGEEPEERVFINPPTFYQEHGIEVRLAAPVRSLDTERRRLHGADGHTYDYERLLLATGAQVRVLDVPGGRLPGVFYLRSLDDSRRIRAAMAEARRAVVIGGGFIAMEVSAVLARKGIDTTMVFPGTRVWQRLFTPEISQFFQRYYEQRGVRLEPRTSVVAFAGEWRVTGVVTDRGDRLPADLVVVGIGVEPATGPLRDAGLRLEDGVVVNEYLEAGPPGVYAAGDVARYRDLLFDTYRRVEHWDNAVEQGRHAARQLRGERQPFVHVPYFFSDVFDLSYEFWGDHTGADVVVSRGRVESGSFSVWWLRSGRLVAAFVLNRPDEERAAASTWIGERRRLDTTALTDADRPLHAAVLPGMG